MGQSSRSISGPDRARRWDGWVGAWGPVIVWTLTIFVASAMPGATYPQPSVPGIDKLVHAVLFGLLAALLARALRSRTRVSAPLGLAFVLTIVYGASDEAHQLFVADRSADVWDLVADAVGAASGVAIARVAGLGLARPRAVR